MEDCRPSKSLPELPEPARRSPTVARYHLLRAPRGVGPARAARNRLEHEGRHHEGGHRTGEREGLGLRHRNSRRPNQTCRFA